jgi:hypothetical protein
MSARFRLLGVLGSLLLPLPPLAAQQFNGGIPSGWTCVGTCGTSGADGVVPLAPGGGTQYGYVSTHNGVNGVALAGVGGSGAATDGSTLRSGAFSASAGDVLNFNFDYVTSDGSGFADYAWARLLDPSFNQVAILFTARTAPSGSIVPGFSMPAPAATLSPSTVNITGCPSSGSCAQTVWSPLGVGTGNGSGDCFAIGCGNTGWITALFSIPTTGSYVLEFGVTNWNDNAYDSGLAFDGLKLNDTPINPTSAPEPATLSLLALGMATLGIGSRRRRNRSLTNA